MAERLNFDFDRMRAEIEARDAAECARLGISAEQLQARRDLERESMLRAERETRLRERRDEMHRAARDLPITAADLRAIVDDKLDDTEPLTAVRDWLATDTPILVMAGSAGRGKTVAACWAVLHHGGRYLRARAFERLFAHRYGEEELAQQSRVLRAGLVVVDDVGGREDSAEGLGAYLLDLVDERRGHGKRTIVITNLPRKLFGERYPDPRLHSRLAQSATWFVTRGEDLRGAK